MRRNGFLLAVMAVSGAAALSVSSFASYSAAASSAPRAQSVVVTFSLAFQPDGTALGTFTAAGAVSDSGVSAASPTVTPINASTGRLTGQQTPHGARGDIVWSFDGITYPLGAPRAIGRGHASVMSGTRDYRGLEGEGHFVTTADFIAMAVAGSIEGTVKPGGP